MKKQPVTTNRLGMLQYFLDHPVQVSTDIEQQQINEDGSEVFAKLAYQGVLLDFDDIWLVLGYYDEQDAPNVVASIKIDRVVSVDVGHSPYQESSETSKAGMN
jgi:hypothetical protein